MKNDKKIYEKAKGFDKNPQNINRTGANRSPMSAILKQLTDDKVSEIEIIMTSDDGKIRTKKLKLETKQDFKTAISFILMQKALAGDLKAIDMIFDRTEGKALEKVQQTIDNKINISPIQWVDDENKQDI